MHGAEGDPRKRWLRSFTASKKLEMPRVRIFSSSICCISSQVAFSTSHISEVIAPRTARRVLARLARAGVDRRGFSGRAHEVQHLARADLAVPAREREERAGDVERREPLLVAGSSPRQQRTCARVTSSTRAVFSARST
jgi:hypothetical protein